MNIIITNSNPDPEAVANAERILKNIRAASAEIRKSPAAKAKLFRMFEASLKEHEDAAKAWDEKWAAIQAARKSAPPRITRRRAAVAA